MPRGSHLSLLLDLASLCLTLPLPASGFRNGLSVIGKTKEVEKQQRLPTPLFIFRRSEFIFEVFPMVADLNCASGIVIY